MARAAEPNTVECPHCGRSFEDWAPGTADIGMDPELADPGWVQAAASATCPHCGHTACCSALAVERERWRA